MSSVQNKDLLSVLVVDDDEVDVEAIQRQFRKKGVEYNLIVARNGIEALEVLEKGIESPFVILLDLNMPKMNGLEFLEVLRNHTKYSTAIVFVWTTSKDERDLWAAYERHIAGYLLKGSAGGHYSGVAEIIEAFERNVLFPHSLYKEV